MNTAGVIATIVLGCGFPLMTGCGSARRGEPLVGEKEITDSELALGRQVFDRKCSQCHPGGERGIGFALNNKPLPQWFIRFQARNGVGAMPAFSDRELSDRELDGVAKYLVWLRRQGR